MFKLFGSVVLILTTYFLYDYIHYIGLFSICGGIGVLGLFATWLFKEKRKEEINEEIRTLTSRLRILFITLTYPILPLASILILLYNLVIDPKFEVQVAVWY